MRDLLALLAQTIFQTDADGVHAQCRREFIHLVFGHKRALWGAEATIRATRYSVCVNAVAINTGVRNFIRATDGDMEIAHYFVAGVVVCACVEIDIGFDGGDFAISRGPPFGVYFSAMAFVMANNAFFATPLATYGALFSSLMQSPRR